MSETVEVKGMPVAAPAAVVAPVEPKEPVKATEPEAPETEEVVSAERLKAMSKHKRAADEKARTLEQQVRDLQDQLDAQANGLSETEQIKTRLKRAEERAAAAEQAKTDAEQRVLRADKQRWIASAASSQNFADPSDASAFLDLDEIETEKDAERAIKRLASQKKYLVKSEERQLPGKVMEGGKAVTQQDGRPPLGIDPMKDANAIVEGLVQFASPEAQQAWRQQHQQ